MHVLATLHTGRYYVLCVAVIWSVFQSVEVCWSECCSVLQGVWSMFVSVGTQIWMSDATRMHESCYKYRQVLSPIWVHLVTCMEASCNTYWGVMSHIQTITYEWVNSHIWLSHITHVLHVTPEWYVLFFTPQMSWTSEVQWKIWYCSTPQHATTHCSTHIRMMIFFLPSYAWLNFGFTRVRELWHPYECVLTRLKCIPYDVFLDRRCDDPPCAWTRFSLHMWPYQQAK